METMTMDYQLESVSGGFAEEHQQYRPPQQQQQQLLLLQQQYHRPMAAANPMPVQPTAVSFYHHGHPNVPSSPSSLQFHEIPPISTAPVFAANGWNPALHSLLVQHGLNPAAPQMNQSQLQALDNQSDNNGAATMALAHAILQQQQHQQAIVQHLQQQQQQLISLAAWPPLAPIKAQPHPQQSHQQQQQQQQQAIQNLLIQPAVIHNLIPGHLQASSQAPSLHGTPGYQPALILPSFVDANTLLAAASMSHAAGPLPQLQLPISMHLPAPSAPSMAGPPPPPPQPAVPLTVQDRNAVFFPPPPAVYQGINLNYVTTTGKRPRQVHTDPPLYLVEEFLSPFECEFLVASANDSWTRAPVVGRGSGEISTSRTSSTCYLAREDLPDYMRKVSALTGKAVEHCELPQVGRYLPSQQYSYHFDAFDLSNEDGVRFASNGGQRVVTVLVYLNDCEKGGETHFPAMDVKVKPRQGTAVVFFPATVDGYLDKNALHAALPAIDTKYVSQVWVRQSNYNGTPSKRLQQTLGIPYDSAGQAIFMLGLQSPVQK